MAKELYTVDQRVVLYSKTGSTKNDHMQKQYNSCMIEGYLCSSHHNMLSFSDIKLICLIIAALQVEHLVDRYYGICLLLSTGPTYVLIKDTAVNSQADPLLSKVGALQ